VPEVWVPDERSRELRRAVAARGALVRQRTQVRNRIHASLLRTLQDAPATDLFGLAGRRWLQELSLPPDERAQVEAALRVHEALESEIALLDRRLAEAALADERVERLMTIPGMGPVSALAMVALVGDIHRFRRPGSLVSYLGLDPKVHQSGEREAWTGHISRAGHAHARGLLVEAAHTAVVGPGPLRAFFRRIEGRRGTQIALVAVARKLAVLAWYLLSTGERYRFERATFVREKRRKLERMLDLPTQRRRRGPGEPTLVALREHERALLAEAEAEYRADLAARKRRKRPLSPRRGKMRGGALVPIAPLFSRGRPRPTREDTPRGLDYFIRGLGSSAMSGRIRPLARSRRLECKGTQGSVRMPETWTRRADQFS
jgi:hypothetical protein